MALLNRFGSIRLPVAALLALASLFVGAGAAFGREASEESIKAGFVFNFVKFALWPDKRETETGPLPICTLGSRPLDGQLARLQGRAIGNRVIEIRTNTPVAELRHCHVLFLDAADADRAEAILRGLANTPVLTVGDLPDFVRTGGMIGFWIEGKRVRFDVNLAAAQAAGLKLSSQMLQLAGRVLQ